MPGCSRINVLHLVEPGIFLDVQDVRMPANQDIWRVLVQDSEYSPIIATGTPGNVSHPDVDALAIESQVFRELLLNFFVINVAVDASEYRKTIHQRLGNSKSEITGMPDLIAILKQLEDPRVKVAMGVRDQADFHVVNANEAKAIGERDVGRKAVVCQVVGSKPSAKF